MNVILQGKIPEFRNELANMVASKKDMTIRITDPKMTDAVANTLSGVGTFAVATLSSGIITLRARGQNTLDGRELFDQLTNKDPSFKDKLGNGLAWLGNLFVGRKFSLDIGNGDSHDALKNRITSLVPELQTLNPDTDPSKIKDPRIKEAFEFAKNNGLMKNDADLRSFQI